MRTIIGLIALCLMVTSSAAARPPGFQDSLLDHFAGEWVLEGMIAGGERIHDVVAGWVLGHQYLRFHEVSRELDGTGEPEYEAIVFIGWDQPSGQYACLWLDSTGGGGLSAQAIGHAKRDGDELAFVFRIGEGSIFHTTFAYSRETDSWQWRMDEEKDGQRQPFARATMTKRE